MDPTLLKSSENEKYRGILIRTLKRVLISKSPDLYFVKYSPGVSCLMFRDKHATSPTSEYLQKWQTDLATILALDSADAVLTDFGKHLEREEKTLFDLRPYLAKITRELEETGSLDSFDT